MTERRRVLFLLPFPPDPGGVHGGSRTTGQLVEALAERHEVAVVHFRAADEPPLPPALRQRLALVEEVPRRGAGAQGWVRGVLRGRPAWVTDWASQAFAARATALVREWRPDVLQAEFHLMGQYLDVASAPARVLVEHEVGVPAAEERLAQERRLLRQARRLDLRAWQRYESRVLRLASAVVAFTEQDVDAVRRLAPTARVACIRPGVPVPRHPSGVGSGVPTMVFVGSFVHPPNVDAALRLARVILPAVRTRVPEARLELVGDRPPPPVRALATEHVVVTGRVEDVEPYLERAAVVALPVRRGGGIRVKAMEALAAGKAVVGTKVAFAGLDVTSEREAVVAGGDADFAAAVASLLEQPERRAALGNAARRYAESELTWSRAVERYGRLYAELLEAPA